MWVQLKHTKHIEVQGRLRTYREGDWVEVGKQVAMRWISEGSAWIPEGQAANLLSADCGVFVLGSVELAEERLGDYAGKIEVQVGGEVVLPWSKTMVWNPALRLRKELVPIGFHLLDTWQMAVPLWDYEKLAAGQGEESDRACTLEVVHDLRVPLYSPDLLFVRRCEATKRLVEIWRGEPGDARFALLRAIYQVKPLVLALPTTWIWKDMGD